jgi:GTP pyrophosphokinase
VWGRVLREYKKKHNLRFNEEVIKEKVNRVFHIDMDVFFQDLGSSKKVLDKKTLFLLFPEVNVPEVVPEKKIAKKAAEIYRLITVAGHPDIDVLFAKCCSPIKGDKITGYITQKRGLVIHRLNCSNLKNAASSRLKEVYWNEDEHFAYLVKYELTVDDKPGILSAVSSVTAAQNSNIRKIEIDKISQNQSKIKISFEVKDTMQLTKIDHAFKTINGIIAVLRKKTS